MMWRFKLGITSWRKQQHISRKISAKSAKILLKLPAESGRDASDIDLIAISKFHPIDAVTAAISAGHYHFGENRVQEAMGKFSALRVSKDTETSPGLRLHLVGSLQSNKAREAAQFFDEIHSLDRLSLAREFCKIRDQGIDLPKLYIQINSGKSRKNPALSPIKPMSLSANAATHTNCRLLV